MLIPHNALVVVTDGTHARFFRNAGQEAKIELSADGELKPGHLHDDGRVVLALAVGFRQATCERALSPRPWRGLRRFGSGRRSADARPTSPVITQGSSEPGDSGNPQDADQGVDRGYPESFALGCGVPQRRHSHGTCSRI